jgi:protein phosphatase
MRVNGAPDRLFSFDREDIRYGARSHIGQRQENQDEIRLPDPGEDREGRGSLFAVADGMGGHMGASLVGRMACDGLEEYHRLTLPETGGRRVRSLGRHLTETLFRIDRRIRDAGKKDPALEEMGTTLSCLLLTDRHALVAHVGDSRIYRLRGGRLTCLTTDHTFVQDMILEGELTPEKAASHPLRHVLTRAVGTLEPLEWVDTRIDPRHPGDRYLLCTDGLYNALETERISALLSADHDAGRAAEELVAAALEKGVRDNTTALVLITASPESRDAS